MKLATNSKAGQGKRFVERIYRLRIAGLALGFFCVASVFLQQHRGYVLWALLLFHGFVWPHVARRAALACEVPYRGERLNLMADAMFGGFWVVAMQFNVLPSVLILAMLSMDNIAAGGLKLFARGVIAHLLECNDTWCRIDVQNGTSDVKGWLARSEIWGLLPGEVVK